MIAAQPKSNYQLVASTAETFFGTSIEAAVSCSVLQDLFRMVGYFLLALV